MRRRCNTANAADRTVPRQDADGREKQSVQPLSSVGLLHREGHLKCSLSAGEYRAGNYNSAEPKFVQPDAMYGLPHGFTGYAGAIFCYDYDVLAVGVGKNFAYIGAIPIRVTQAKTKLAKDEVSRG
ncbi:fimbria/pilus outer membrane usher protein, partial [Salmonella enterica]|uniref:fimbria/pilus outer membrane usher protein n=1 Tax=Salmonella enterica TaxID=28901 RepID=UPI00398C2D94